MKMEKSINYNSIWQSVDAVNYYCFLFVAASVGGWCMEVLFRSIVHHQLTIPGFLLGPYCPIYGMGMLLVMFLCDPKHKVTSYFKIVILTSLLEYVISFISENLFGRLLWDYSGLPLSIGTRVSLVFSLAWGLLGMGFLLLVEPRMSELYKKNRERSINLSVVFLIMICMDMIACVIMQLI
ncbi:MAG: putative ABC transporter permease [Lachnospiraceae bacterium]|nr:putative ABC transporter permease [Lachnospiraceae bacterium]MDD3616268.1 putative ABC transporter permease [Lachnospiraceae bacterium]